MNLEEAIYKRQSIRSYESAPLSDETIEEIRNFIDNTKALNPDIKYSYEIVPTENIKTLLPWKAPHYILLYSEEKENYQENLGFIFQQVDLFLQSNNIGSCWIGMGSPKNFENEDTEQKFIIAMSFGKTNQEHRQLNEFQRNELSQISDKEDERLIPAQLAPSAINSQPWYFTHNNDGCYNIYRKKFNVLKRKLTEKWNRIDIGITLAHLYISNKDTFKFFMKDNPEELNDYYYEGSFEL